MEILVTGNFIDWHAVLANGSFEKEVNNIGREQQEQLQNGVHDSVS